MIRVQTEDFDHHTEYLALQRNGVSGAIVTFTGLVREFSNNGNEEAMQLQHYPGMTEKVLRKIETDACERWELIATSIVHRVGRLAAGDQIVFVGVSSKHRHDAFAAAAYIMDILKTEAPFWKKEGERWVEAKDSDQQAAHRWLIP